MTTIYKVAIDDGDCYRSVCSQWRDISKCALAYKIGKITRPEIEDSKIFAFDKYEYAKVFAEYNCATGNTIVVLECEGHINDSISTERVAGLSFSDVVKFWELAKTAIGTFEYLNVSMSAPVGSICCDWVKPVRAVIQMKQTLENGKFERIWSELS